jgi:hypothetical protein
VAVSSNPFTKNSTGEITSSKTVPEAAPKQVEEKKIIGDPAPKKLVVSDIFKTQAK